MLHDTPLRDRHEAFLRSLSDAQPVATGGRPGAATGGRLPAGAIQYVPYALPGQSEPACELVAMFDQIEPEYAAIRRGSALLDCPQRGTVIVAGGDRREFLNRMLTQEFKDFTTGTARSSFWLNRKGRIDADVLVLEPSAGEERTILSVDIHQAASTVQSLSEFQFSDDVAVRDASAEFHHLSLHGPEALRVIAAASGAKSFALEPGAAATILIDSVEVVVARHDQTGEIGLELIAPFDRAGDVWEALLACGDAGPFRCRPVGWFAYNIARIEAGTPLMNIDFSSQNLPHETGILRQRVSFTKGCYLGQEIVARMENLGKPKQQLVGLRMQDDLLPGAGSQVFAIQDDAMGEQIGVVTSSTLSPMLSAAPIAFAMLKTSHAAPGAAVLVNAEGEQARAEVAALRFLQEAR